jgi:hypothetical protein
MRATLGVVIVLAVAAALWYAKTAIFLALAGVLLAIALHGTSSALSRVTGLPHLLSLAIVVVLITGFLARPSSSPRDRPSPRRSLARDKRGDRRHQSIETGRQRG